MVDLFLEDHHTDHSNSYVEGSVFVLFFVPTTMARGGKTWASNTGAAAAPPQVILYTIALSISMS
jgi:hypothetical protein